MTDLKSLRGMNDLMPTDHARHEYVITKAQKMAQNYGFLPMATPILEPLAVFSRTLGETTDVVSKEMYDFMDKSGDHITLRPENTASVMRAFANQGLYQQIPQKFFYAGPMFRYERPQKGRLRQFHQIGIELIGPNSPQADIEVIACGAAIIENLGIGDGVCLQLNSLGNQESRGCYRMALIEYFNDHHDKLSEESQERLKRNPMRILDSKDKTDRQLVENAPKFYQFFDHESQDFFDEVKSGLDGLNIAYDITPQLVRGLDYYCHTAFEFVSDRLGAQATILGGGRYDGLADYMGFAPIPAVGFAAGIERMALLIKDLPSRQRPIVFIPMGGLDIQKAMMKLMNHCRQSGLYCEMGYSGNMSKRMKQANKINASHAIIMGEDEFNQQTVQIKDFDQSTQSSLPLNHIYTNPHQILS